MGTKEGQNWYQSIHYDVLSCRGLPQGTPSREEHKRVKKYYKAAKNVYVPLVMVSIGERQKTLAGKRVHQNGSIEC
jgi:hypothetical protein